MKTIVVVRRKNPKNVNDDVRISDKVTVQLVPAKGQRSENNDNGCKEKS